MIAPVPSPTPLPPPPPKKKHPTTKSAQLQSYLQCINHFTYNLCPNTIDFYTIHGSFQTYMQHKKG